MGLFTMVNLFVNLVEETVESVLEMPVSSAKSSEACVSRQQMPLTFLRSGECASVLKVRGGGETHHHLENLGFVAGAPIRVVSEQNGNIIVEVKGAQIALDRSAASKIITC